MLSHPGPPTSREVQRSALPVVMSRQVVQRTTWFSEIPNTDPGVIPCGCLLHQNAKSFRRQDFRVGYKFYDNWYRSHKDRNSVLTSGETWTYNDVLLLWVEINVTSLKDMRLINHNWGTAEPNRWKVECQCLSTNPHMLLQQIGVVDCFTIFSIYLHATDPGV